MTVTVDTLQLGILILAAIFVVIMEVVRVVSAIKTNTKEDNLKMIKSWLLSIIVNAEKVYGGKTGKVKLSYVYGLFIEKFPKLAKIITFETFSALVDEVLKINENFIENTGTTVNLGNGFTISTTDGVINAGTLLTKADSNEGI